MTARIIHFPPSRVRRPPEARPEQAPPPPPQPLHDRFVVVWKRVGHKQMARDAMAGMTAKLLQNAAGLEAGNLVVTPQVLGTVICRDYLSLIEFLEGMK